MPNQTTINPNPTIHQDVSDLIANTPGCLLYSGITIVAIVFSTIMMAAYFIHYPDKIVSTGMLTSDNPPIEMVCRTSGYIDTIIKANGTSVQKGDALLYINNTTNQQELIQLKDWIIQYEIIEDPRIYLRLSFPRNFQLGKLQGEYANLQLQYNELCQTLRDGLVFQQMNNITREILKIKKLNRSMTNEKNIYGRELALTNKDHTRNIELNDTEVISDLELENSQIGLLQKERQYEGMTKGIIQNNIRIEQLSLDKLKLKEQRANLIKNYQFSIAETISRIGSNIKDWKQSYTISATIDGVINYNAGLSEKKSIKQGKVIGHILPFANNDKYISAIYPITNIGKIEKGQRAIIKFIAFPYQEFGSVKSIVLSISKVPELNKDNQPMYEIVLPLNQIIITDYNDTIPYRPNMTVSVEIITEDRSVLQRIFHQFLSLINSS